MKDELTKSEEKIFALFLLFLILIFIMFMVVAVVYPIIGYVIAAIIMIHLLRVFLES